MIEIIENLRVIHKNPQVHMRYKLRARDKVHVITFWKIYFISCNRVDRNLDKFTREERNYR